jgi:O-antigen ligase
VNDHSVGPSLNVTAGSARVFLADLRLRFAPRALPSLYISALCLVYLMHNIWAARTVYDFIVLPLAVLAFRRRELLAVAKEPAFLAAASYFACLGVAGLAASDRDLGMVARHLKDSVQVLSFLGVTAILVRRGGERFIAASFLSMSLAAALGAGVNVVLYYRDLPIHELWTNRLEGIPGVTVYYNSNVVGDIYGMALAAALAVLARGQLRALAGILTAIAAAVLLAAVLLTGSRGALLGVIAGSAVVLALCVDWRWRIGILLATAGGLLLLDAYTPLPRELLARADSSRLSLWPIYLRLAAIHPWLGYGLAYDTAFKLPNGLLIMNAHNIILAALIRGGILSAISLLAVLIAAAHCAWRGWVAARTPFALVLMAACILLTAVDHEFLASPLGFHWLLLWLPVGISIGVAGLAQSPPSPPPRQPLRG